MEVYAYEDIIYAGFCTIRLRGPHGDHCCLTKVQCFNIVDPSPAPVYFQF